MADVLAGANPAGTSQPRNHLAAPSNAADSPQPMPGPNKKSNGDRKTLTIRLPVAVIERLKRIARVAAGHPCYATVTSICENGIATECARIEDVMREAFRDPPEEETEGSIQNSMVTVSRDFGINHRTVRPSLARR